MLENVLYQCDGVEQFVLCIFTPLWQHIIVATYYVEHCPKKSRLESLDPAHSMSYALHEALIFSFNRT